MGKEIAGSMSWAWRKLKGTFVDAGEGLVGQANKEILAKADNVTSRVEEFVGKFKHDINEVATLLRTREPNKLHSQWEELGHYDPDTHESYLQQMLDKDASKRIVPDTEPKRRLYELNAFINAALAGRQIDVEVLRRLPSKDLVETIVSDKNYRVRLPTEEGMQLFTEGGEDFINWAEQLIKNNKFKFKTPALKQKWLAELQRDGVTGITSKSGMMEFSRELVAIPDVVKSRGGRIITVFHTDPYKYLSTMLFRSTMRVEMSREFGAKQLENVSDGLSLDKYVKRTMKVLGQYVDRKSRNYLVAELASAAKVSIETFDGMSRKQLLKMAEIIGVNTDYTPDELLQYINNIGEHDIQNAIIQNVKTQLKLQTQPDLALIQRQQTKLVMQHFVRLGRRLGGVDTKHKVSDLLHQIKTRMNQVIDDNVLEHLLNKINMTVGENTATQKLLKRLQGVPVVQNFTELNPIVAGAKFVDDIANSILTSKFCAESFTTCTNCKCVWIG